MVVLHEPARLHMTPHRYARSRSRSRSLLCRESRSRSLRHTSYISTFATSSGVQNPWATYVVCRTSACVQEWQAAWQVPNKAFRLYASYITGKQQISNATQE